VVFGENGMSEERPSGVGTTGEALVATFDLYHPEFPLSPTLDALPELRLEPELQPVAILGTTQRTMFVEVTGATVDAVAEAMAADPTVEDATPVETGDGRTVFRVTVTSIPSLPATLLEEGVRVVAAHSSGGGWRVRLTFPDRQALQAFVTAAREAGFDATLVRLYTAVDGGDAGAGRGPFGLTPDERETLAHAYETGYFETPRAISQSDLAAELDVSGSVLSRQLRRALAKLVANALDPDGNPRTGDHDRSDPSGPDDGSGDDAAE
jgi:predicted DNA binding protein